MSNKPSLTREAADMLLRYGELSQATYDRLGTDPTKPDGWGYATEEAPKLLDYLKEDYDLPPSSKSTGTRGTGDIYSLPAATDDLSPLIHAVPGALANAATTRRQDLLDKLQGEVTPLIAKLEDKTGALFTDDPETGRPKERSGFMGYVAVSKDKAGDTDVALVWRGTVFSEEWQRNFQDDKLVKWPGQSPPTNIDDLEDAKPSEVGVHAGFCKLYLKPGLQPGTDSKKLKNGPFAPRQVVHMWLARLLSEQRVTTITVTGHLLGAALATVCAYDVAEALPDWDTFKQRCREELGAPPPEEWATTEAPKVAAITWAPPRSGNWTYSQRLTGELGVRVLRICNKGDIVPRVPGLWPQLLTSIWYMLGFNVYSDMESIQAQLFGQSYNFVCRISHMLWQSRWGYFHAGQILELDSDAGLTDADGNVIGEAKGLGQKHSLEVYLYMLSRLGGIERNRLLMNKGADILCTPFPQTTKAAKQPPVGPPPYPARWWHDPSARGVDQDSAGRWYLPDRSARWRGAKL